MENQNQGLASPMLGANLNGNSYHSSGRTFSDHVTSKDVDISPSTLGGILKLMNVNPDMQAAIEERVLTDPKLIEKFASYKLADVDRSALRSNAKPVYICKYITSTKDIELLQSWYPEFNVLPGDGTVKCVNHALAREQRMLEHVFIYTYVLKYKNEIILDKGYDVYVKDIGGYPTVHSYAGRSNVHVCFPTISSKDHIRKAAFDEHIQEVAPETRVNSRCYPIVRDYITGSPRLVCHKLGQYCSCKAPYLTFIHSTYDMSMLDVAMCFDISNATTGYIVMLYSPEIEIDVKGEFPQFGCKWHIYEFAGTKYINFTFSTDAGFTYNHKFSDYISLVHQSHFVSPAGNAYIIDREIRNCTLHMKVVKVQNGFINKESIIRYMPFPDDPDVRFVATYKYDTTGRNDKMTPIVIKTTQSFLQASTMFAMSLGETKFTVDALRRYMVSANSQVTVSTTVHSGPGHTYDELTILSYTLYMMIYTSNYESSKATQNFIKDEDHIRAISNRCYIVRLFFRLWYSSRGQSQHPLMTESGIYSSNDEFNHIMESLTIADSAKSIRSGHLDSVLHKLERAFPDFKRKYPLAISGPRVLVASEIIEQQLIVSEPPRYTASHPISPEGYLHADGVVSMADLSRRLKADPFLAMAISVANVRAKEASNTTSFLSAFRRSSSCRKRFKCIEIPGDGNCFFHCVLKALSIRADPTHLRKRLLCSKWLEVICSRIVSGELTIDYQDVCQLKERLSADTLPALDKSKWADDTVILLCALELSVEVCVHTRTQIYSYNSSAHHEADKLSAGTCIHMKLDNNHFTLLEEDASDLECSEYAILSAEPGEQRVTYSPFEEDLLSGLVTPTSSTDPTLKIVKSHRDYAATNNEFVLAHKYGYDSFYGPMLSVAFKHLSFQPEPTILDIDPRNKSSLQFLCDTDFAGTAASVMSLSVGRFSAVPVVTNRPPVVNRIAFRLQGQRDFERFLRADEKFDAVVINPAYYSDDLGLINPRFHFEHIQRLLHSIDFLEDGGHMVISILLPVDLETLSLATKLVPLFETVYLVDPLIKPAYVPWAFLVCSSKKSSSVKPSSLLLTVNPSAPNEVARFDSLEDFPNRIASVAEALSESHAQRLLLEVNHISRRTMGKASAAIIDQYKSFVPLRLQLPVTGGFLLDSFLPSFYESRLAVAPQFDLKFLSDYFPELGTSALLPQHFSKTVDGFSRVLYDFMVSRLKITDVSSAYIRALIDSPSISDDFDRKYLVALFISLKQGKSLVRLNLKPIDFGKPLSSRSFYSNCLSRFFSFLLVDTSEKFCKAPELPGNYGQVPQNYDLFPTESELISPTFALKLDDEQSELDSDFDDNFQSMEPSIPAGYVASNSFWMPDAYVPSGKSSGDMAGQYYSEFVTITHTYVNSLQNDVSSALQKCVQYVMSSENRKVLSTDLKPFIGEDYYDGCVLKINNTTYVSPTSDGSKLANVLNNRRYVMLFDIERNKMVNPRIVSTKTANVNRARNYISITKFEVFMEKDIKETIENYEFSTIPSVSIVQAGPGCGKTHTILERMCNDDEGTVVAVMKNRENVASAAGRLRKMIASRKLTKNAEKLCKEHVTSIDNVIKNYREYFDKKYSGALIDEAMTHHPGKIALAAAILGCPVILFGDVMQIGYICRTVLDRDPVYTDTSKAYPISGLLETSYRCPRDVCYKLSPGYAPIASALGMQVTDPSSVLKSKSTARTPSMSVKQISVVNEVQTDCNTKFLTFTQSEKDELNTKLPSDNKASTIHEYQGNENPKVAIVRLRVINDVSYPNGIYNSDQHIVSGVSRHTKSLIYYTVDPTDKLSQYIADVNLSFPRWKPAS